MMTQMATAIPAVPWTIQWFCSVFTTSPINTTDWPAKAKGERQGKQQENTRFSTVTWLSNNTENLLALTLTSTPKIGWQGKMKLR